MDSGLPDRFSNSLNTSVLAGRVDNWTSQRVLQSGMSEHGPHSVTLHCVDSNLTAQLAGLAARFLQLEIERVFGVVT